MQYPFFNTTYAITVLKLAPIVHKFFAEIILDKIFGTK